jgi:hypothetical protein
MSAVGDMKYKGEDQGEVFIYLKQQFQNFGL